MWFFFFNANCLVTSPNQTEREKTESKPKHGLDLWLKCSSLDKNLKWGFRLLCWQTYEMREYISHSQISLHVAQKITEKKNRSFPKIWAPGGIFVQCCLELSFGSFSFCSLQLKFPKPFFANQMIILSFGYLWENPSVSEAQDMVC